MPEILQLGFSKNANRNMAYTGICFLILDLLKIVLNDYPKTWHKFCYLLAYFQLYWHIALKVFIAILQDILLASFSDLSAFFISYKNEM